ncbi:MAG: hypothetical protein ACRD1R_14045 [Acidobacteriota bacterium]
MPSKTKGGVQSNRDGASPDRDMHRCSSGGEQDNFPPAHRLGWL